MLHIQVIAKTSSNMCYMWSRLVFLCSMDKAVKFVNAGLDLARVLDT